MSDRARPGLPPISSSRPSLRFKPTQARKLASNFAILGTAEVLCRGVSILVTLSLMRRLLPAGYGRVEFAFNVIFWLVLIVRDCFESIVTRELARHPRITRRLVDRVMAVKLVLAVSLYLALATVNGLTLAEPRDRTILLLYGLLIFTTSLGLDYVFRGSERMSLVALSLIVRTAVYAVGVWITVQDASRIVWVPLWLVAGECCGIALVWAVYARQYGLPRPHFGLRFAGIMLRRGRSVCLIHLSQTVIISADLMVVGLWNEWSEVGRYGAPLRMVTAAMAFGLIFQQVVFPSLARSCRASREAGQRLVNQAVRVLVTGFLPMAVGGVLLSEPLVAYLFPPEYRDCGPLLALGICRAPLLCLAFLYQSALIAMNREAAGVRILVAGALVSFPLITLFRWQFGLTGASFAVVLLGLGLVVAGFARLRAEGRQPHAHHYLAKPLLACLAMAPACLLLLRLHVLAAVVGGAGVYLGVLFALGGLHFRAAELGRSRVPLRGQV